MTERTLSGKPRPRGQSRAASRRTRAEGPAAFANLGPVVWSVAMLAFSFALAAAAVFTHKAL
jgi:hypothetical protein